MRPREVLREAVADVMAHRGPALVSTLVVAAVAVAILVTTGRTVAGQQRVLAEIGSPGGRLISLVDGRGSAAVHPSSVHRIAALDGVEWAVGLGPAQDVSVTSEPAHQQQVPARTLHGRLPPVIHVDAYREPRTGDAVVGPGGARRTGLVDAVGAVHGARLDAPVVGRFTASAPLEDLEEGVLVVAGPGDTEPLRSVLVSVRDVRDLEVLVPGVVAVVVARDPAALTVTSSLDRVQLQRDVGAELAASSRAVVVGVLLVGMSLVGLTQLAAVAQRTRDHGRRRALGASRTLVVVHVLVQVGLCAVTGTAVGTAVGLAADQFLVGGTPGPRFTLAVAVLCVLAPLAAAVPPAVHAARRDPVRILRVP